MFCPTVQVSKLSLSARVVDAQMPDNHFSAQEKALLLVLEKEQPPKPLEDAFRMLRRGEHVRIRCSNAGNHKAL